MLDHLFDTEGNSTVAPEEIGFPVLEIRLDDEEDECWNYISNRRHTPLKGDNL